MTQKRNSTTFDLWEEVSGTSFFTTQSQYRSLVSGSALASSLGLSCPSCDSQAPQILCFLNSPAFFDASKGFLLGNINIPNFSRSGIDANTLLGPLAVFDVNAKCDSPTLQPCHSKVLSTFKVFVDTFRDPALYPINAGISPKKGVAVGRYPEDIYYTGNPWYLITLGAAELLYDAVAQWEKQGFIAVDKTNLAFFKDFYSLARAGTVYRAWPLLNSLSPFSFILNAVTEYADSFVSVVQKYTPASGSLAEQFLKTAPGTPTSADNLTWSFAAFLSMTHRRNRQFPPSWIPTSSSSSPLNKLPPSGNCQPSSAKGTYTPATLAGAPPLNITCQSTILFQVNASTYYGENIYLTGNSSDLGNWDLGNAIPMQSTNYTSERPLWFAKVPLTAGEKNVGYAFVREQDCGRGWIWEDAKMGKNRTVDVPGCVEGEDEETVRGVTDDVFRGEGGRSGGC